MPRLPDPMGAIEAALAAPVDAPPLSALARGKRSPCILICDITRPVPNGLFLPALVRTLLDAGVPREGVTILVATGLHRPNEGAELAELVGDPWVIGQVRVVNHLAREDADHVHLGRTPRGTVVRLDRRFVDARPQNAAGVGEPPFFARWAGGGEGGAPRIAPPPASTNL